jgi:hypothetical protein
VISQGVRADLGEAPSAPTTRRAYKAVKPLIPVAVLLIALWPLLR